MKKFLLVLRNPKSSSDFETPRPHTLSFTTPASRHRQSRMPLYGSNMVDQRPHVVRTGVQKSLERVGQMLLLILPHRSTFLQISWEHNSDSDSPTDTPHLSTGQRVQSSRYLLDIFSISLSLSTGWARTSFWEPRYNGVDTVCKGAQCIMSVMSMFMRTTRVRTAWLQYWVYRLANRHLVTEVSRILLFIVCVLLYAPA